MNDDQKLEQGIHSISEEEYHSDPCPEASLSSSVAYKLLGRSPYHAWLAHPKLNPDYKPENRRIYDPGRAAHAMLLDQSGEYYRNFNLPRDRGKIAVLEHNDYRKNITKEERDEAYDNGLTPLLAKEYAVVKQMIEVAKQKIELTEFKGILESGKSEQSLIWQMEGVWCRGRADRISTQNNWDVIMDYKTTTNAHPEAWIKNHIMDYVLQACFYLEGYYQITGNQANFFFFVQENTPPYDCSVIGLSETLLDIGRAKVARAIKLWGECLKSDKWDGYPAETLYAEAPQWAIYQHEMET